MTLKIFLGGTCNNSTWREYYKENLKIDYFDPVVDDWTPECIKEEEKQKISAAFVLYTITPRMKGVYTICEMTESSILYPDTTLINILSVDDDFEFTLGEWKSIEAVVSKCVKNGAKYFKEMKEVVEYVNLIGSKIDEW